MQLLQVDAVSEPFNLEAREIHERYSGVAPLIGSSIADLAKKSQEVKVEHAQEEYDALTADCATSRADKIKEVKELLNTRT